MTDFKIRGTCAGCRKTRWFIRKRKVRLPTGTIATSKDLFCSRCFTPQGKKALENSIK